VCGCFNVQCAIRRWGELEGGEEVEDWFVVECWACPLFPHDLVLDFQLTSPSFSFLFFLFFWPFFACEFFQKLPSWVDTMLPFIDLGIYTLVVFFLELFQASKLKLIANYFPPQSSSILLN